ncbi:MAG: BamA/TamA family outer membrane protein, partial [Myxococcota bacterium]|nr:BamA/TamA family outer membrane protein [Myxococcota bacterium]
VRVSRLAEEALDPVAELMGFMPQGIIDVVLSDSSDRANGSATVMPKNTLRLYLAAPIETTGLSTYDDWLRILITHELAHICDIDQSWGLTRFLRWIFGKYISMNGFTPQFLTEGYAVYAETNLTSTGRGRSSYVAMLLRMAALEGKFLAIDQGHIQFADWPGGNAAYFYGGLFHLWLEKRFGKEAVAELHQFNAAMPIPYFYWPGAKVAFGQSLESLWDEWQAEFTREAQKVQAEVMARGMTESRRLTHHGRNITGATYSPDGTFVIYSRTSPVDGSTVRRVERSGQDDRYLVLQTFSPRFSFTPDGENFYFSQNAINERFNDYSDLYRYDLATNKTIQLRYVNSPKESLRARDPGVSSDGKRLVFVRNKLHQSWVETVNFVEKSADCKTVCLSAPKVLIPAHGDMQHASPRFSPDGRWVALSSWFPGGHRDIIIVDSMTGAIHHRVTNDRALDGNPTWSPDGRYLLFDSDRDGIFNIYAYDLEERTHFRVTRVVGGAFQPDVAPSGDGLLFRNASGIGFDIHEMSFDPQSWTVEAYQPDPSAAGDVIATDGKIVSLTRREEPAVTLRDTERERAYSPWPTLLPFQDNWVMFPMVYTLNGDPTLALSTFGQDVLGEHGYGLGVSTSLQSRELSWSASYRNDVWYPTFGLDTSSRVVSWPALEEDGVTRWWAHERRRSVGAVASLPIKARHLLQVSYRFEEREPTEERAFEVLNPGTFARLQFGYRYSFARRYPRSVSAEHGRSIGVGGRWYARALGASFDQLMMTLDAREYINNPWADNQVLALRLVTALSLGPDYEERFVLGGVGGASILTAQTDDVFPLRGFAFDKDEGGTGMAVLYTEYRFPIWHVQRGLWTLPVYFRKVHGAVFAEGGNTFGNGSEEDVMAFLEKGWRRLRGGRLGLGAELRADLSLGWAFPLTLRLGAAVPWVNKGLMVEGAFRDKAVFYFSLGSTL